MSQPPRIISPSCTGTQADPNWPSHSTERHASNSLHVLPLGCWNVYQIQSRKVGCRPSRSSKPSMAAEIRDLQQGCSIWPASTSSRCAGAWPAVTMPRPQRHALTGAHKSYAAAHQSGSSRGLVQALEAAFGDQHPMYARGLLHMADVERVTNNKKAAIALMRRVVDILDADAATPSQGGCSKSTSAKAFDAAAARISKPLALSSAS